MDVKTLRLSHLSLGVSELETSERFYRDVLGLPVRREDGEVFIELPDFLLVLTESPPAGRSKLHIGFRVDEAADVDFWARRVSERGGEIASGPANRDDGRAVYALDPDHYVIEFYWVK